MGLFDKLFGKKDKEEIKKQADKEKETIGKESNKVEIEEEKEEKRIKSFLIFGLRYDKVVNSSNISPIS